MSTKLLVDATAGVGGLVTADDGSSASTIALRDASNDLYANNMRGTRGLRTSGSLYIAFSSQSSNFSIDENTTRGTVFLCDTTSADITVTLPAATGFTGKYLTIKKTNAANFVLIDGNGTETIDGALIFPLYRLYDQVTIACDGSNWHVVGYKPGLIFANVVASSAVHDSLTETNFDQSVSLAANSWRAGDVIRARAWVRHTATVGADTSTVRLKLGSTAIVSSGALDVINDDLAYIDATIQCRTIGASGTLVASGVVSIGTAATATAKPFYLASTVFDTTAAITLAVSEQWSTTNANSSRLDSFVVQRLAA
jgi:hypothetical protein